MANHHADIPNRAQARDVAHPGTWTAAVIVAMLALVFVQDLVTNPTISGQSCGCTWATSKSLLISVTPSC